ncbi:hypothetical protein [Clostridium folliculivorans]|uniref:Uncharacterized protein n=1 Tax=Clostridium folliculivorans TaxID=2886038 RepID=A0A9W5XZZ6_9CLOT|nr:hypothetical protein [Clostridium folliculivorans]GKU24082.1 hypothetical protein CFOLD11_09080 [Clostridium folliculivorans]GKU30188.1 hypothetical protein CFB3_22950 [Clostridium folliculivorans]
MVDSITNSIVDMRNMALSKYEAWFLVLLAVLLVLAAVLIVAMTIWCVTHGHGTFTGNYSWKDFWTLNVKCQW